MFKRVRWVGMGLAAGAGGTVWAQYRLRRRVERYLPAQVRADVAARVRAAGTDLRDAFQEGRAAMADREAQLRAQLHLAPPAPEGADGDEAVEDEPAASSPPRLRVVGDGLGRPGR